MRVLSILPITLALFCLFQSIVATHFLSRLGERRLTERRLTIETSGSGDWEEATLVEDERVTEHESGIVQWLWNKWKRATSTQPGAGGVPITNVPSQNLTGGPTTNTSGAAGNNTSGSVTGLIGTTDAPGQQYVNCSDITTGRANRCWAELNLTAYVNDWLSKAVCAAGEGFASCFLRQNGFPGLDCTHISGSACPAPQSDRILDDPKRFYVAYNIYGKPVSTLPPRHWDLTFVSSHQRLFLQLVDRGGQQWRDCQQQHRRNSPNY